MAHDPRTDVEVVDVGPDDWRRWRRVRLRALGADPGAFSSSVVRERDLDEAAWRDLLAVGPRVVAVHDGVDVGLAGAHLADGPDRPQLFGMWVDPSQRGRGIGAVLVEAVVARLEAAGHARVHLWVMADNPAARHLYEHAGFTVDPAPRTTAPGACEVAMRRPLGSRS